MQSHAVEHLHHTWAGKEAHHLVLKGDEEDAGARVALTSGTSTQLTVHAAALVTLGADDGQTASLAHLGGEFDIRTTTSHVGGDGHHAQPVDGTTGLCHNLGLLLVQLGVEHVVRDVAQAQHAAQQLADFDRGGTHQHGAAALAHEFNLVDDGGKLLLLRLVHAVGVVDARHGLVGGDGHHVEFVDVPELARLGLGGTGHTGEFVVHAEVVLQRDGGKGLRGAFHGHSFLGLDSLVQAVAVAASFHDAAGLLVHDFHLAVLGDHILVVAVEQGVGFEQLGDSVHALGLHGIVAEQLVLAGHLVLVANVLVAHCRELRGDVGEHKELRVVGAAGEHVNALVGEFHRVVLLLDDEEQGVGHHGHLAVVVLHIVSLGLEHGGFHAFLAQELNQRLVLGQTLIGAEQAQRAFLLVFFVITGHQALGIGQQAGHELALGVVDALHIGLVFIEHLVLALGHGTGNDEWRTGIIDEHRVHLVDNGIIVRALHHVLGAHGHVVAQIVETELTVGTEGDVAVIGRAALGRVGLGLVDAGHAQSVEHIKRPHPLRVTLGQVIIHCDHMHTVTRQGVEKHRQRSHKRLSFTGCHLGNLALMQHRASDELHIVVHHVPHRFVATGHPMIDIDGFIALHVHKIMAFCGQVAVHLRGGDLDGLILGEAACRLFHDGEHLGQGLVELVLQHIENFLLQLVHPLPKGLALVVIDGFDFCLDFRNLVALWLHSVAQVLADLLRALTQAVVVQPLDFGICSLDFFDNRAQLLHVTVRLAAEQRFQNVTKSHFLCNVVVFIFVIILA